jgi:hypothetical protein
MKVIARIDCYAAEESCFADDDTNRPLIAKDDGEDHKWSRSATQMAWSDDNAAEE